MKKALTLSLALFALPLAADEAAKKSGSQSSAPQATVLTAPPAATTGDSPLVAASKRANRKGRKPTNVITNETLKQPKNAHITTTTNPGPTPVKVDSVTEIHRANREKEARTLAAQKASAEEQARKDKEAKTGRLALAAAAAESDYVDPGQAEAELAAAAKDVENAQKKPPQQ